MTSPTAPVVFLAALAVLAGWLIGRRRVHTLELALAQARAELGSNEARAQEREQAVESMLAPVREALQRTHEQIARIEKERAEDQQASEDARSDD